MVEDSLRVLIDRDYIKESLDNIIEAFVEFYGESERDYITNKFRNTIILTIRNTEILKDNIVDVKNSLIRETFSYPKEELILFDVDKLYKDFTSNTDEELINLEPTELQLLFGETDIDTIKRKIKNKEYPKVNEFVRRYPEIKQIISPYEKQYQRQKKQEEEIDQKYFDMLLNEYIDLIPKKDIERYKSTNIPTTLIRTYFGNNITTGICFGDESEKQLNDPNTPEWKRSSILIDRINYFRFIGCFDGKNIKYAMNKKTYDELMKDPKVQDIVKQMNDTCNKIFERKQELQRDRAIDITRSIENYRKNRAIVDSYNLLDKDDPVCPSVYMNPTSCFTENFQHVNGKFIFKPIILINMDTHNLDVAVIHELNHDYEQNTINVDINGVYSTCGFEESSLEFNPEYDESIEETYLDFYDEICRPYEFINEYINESIAFDIAGILHRKGQCIYEIFEDRSISPYLTLDIIMSDFYQEFKNIIKVSRSHSNMRYLLDRIGEENFEALNNLCNEFYQRFGYGEDASEVVNMYIDRIENEDTIDLHNMIQRKEQIMASIRDYYSNVKQTL